MKNYFANSLVIKTKNRSIKIKFKNLFLCGGVISSPHLLIKNRLIKYQKKQNDFEFHINFKTVVKFKDDMINSNLSTVSIYFLREFSI